MPDRLKDDTRCATRSCWQGCWCLCKAGFELFELLDSGQYTHEQILEVLHFLQKKLFLQEPETKNLEDAELVIYLRNKLNRPMRVCGMVPNVGEPGGGPFLAYNPDGTVSLQILESSQIDMNDPAKKEMFVKGTHFNWWIWFVLCAITKGISSTWLLLLTRLPASSRINQKMEKNWKRWNCRDCGTGLWATGTRCS